MNSMQTGNSTGNVIVYNIGQPPQYNNTYVAQRVFNSTQTLTGPWIYAYADSITNSTVLLYPELFFIVQTVNIRPNLTLNISAS